MSIKAFKFVIIMLIVGCYPALAGAQTLGLKEAVKKAMENYPFLAQQQALVRKAATHETTQKNYRLPSLTVQMQQDAGSVNSLAGSYFTFGMVPSVSSGNAAQSSTSIELGNVAIAVLQWDFFNFGYLRATEQQAAAQTHLEQAIEDATMMQVRQEVVIYYLEWIKKYKLLHIQEQDIQRNAVILSGIAANVRSGLKAGADTSTARALVSGATIAYLNTLAEFQNIGVKLCLLTGAVPDTSLLPDPNVLDILPHAIAVFTHFADTVPATQPQLRVINGQYAAQMATTNVLRKKMLPKFGMTAAFWNRSTAVAPTGAASGDFSKAISMPYARYNYLLGVTGTYNLSDFIHRRDLLAEQQLETESIQDNYKGLQQQLSGLLAQLNAGITNTLSKLSELPVLEAAAARALEQQTALYKSGLNTLTDVTNAEYIMLQAQKDVVTAQYDLLELIYGKANATNRTEDFLQLLKN
jgi:outer membrane protein, adhesin transport system